MADTVTTRYIYPPNWDGYYPDKSKPPRRYTIHLTCLSDGTGETNVIKVALGDFLTELNQSASKFVIESIQSVIYGFTYVGLAFDRDPNETIALMGDSEHLDFTREGGLLDSGEGGTGNIVLTTGGVDSGDTYDIKMTFRVK